RKRPSSPPRSAPASASSSRSSRRALQLAASRSTRRGAREWAPRSRQDGGVGSASEQPPRARSGFFAERTISSVQAVPRVGLGRRVLVELLQHAVELGAGEGVRRAGTVGGDGEG